MKIVQSAIAVITLAGILYSAVVFAQDKLNILSSSQSSISELSSKLDEQKKQIEQLQTVAAEINTANSRMKELSKEFEATAISNSIVMQQVSLDNIRREKRSLLSKDHYSNLEPWEHSELLRLQDDEKELEQSIENQRKALNAVTSM